MTLGNIHQFQSQLLAGILATSPWEWAASVFGVMSVLLSYHNSVWLYPTGLLSTGIYAWLLSRAQHALYAEALLNLYYFVMSVYGWWHWIRKGPGEESLPISRWTSGDRYVVLMIVSLLWALFFVLLSRTDSNVPAADAFVSATACTGMWLLAARKVENWLLLNLSNLAAIPLLFYKGLYVTMLLTLFLFIVACFGYVRWLRLCREQIPG